MPHFVYIMANAERAIYVGMTNNLARRVREHKSDRKRAFTQWFHMHTLVYYETVPDLTAARVREKYLKTWARPRKLKLVDSLNPRWLDLTAQIPKQAAQSAPVLGLLADSHDNVRALKAALTLLRARGVTHLLHAGDLTSAATLNLFKGWNLEVAYGNNDIDPNLKRSAKRMGIALAESWEGSFGQIRVAAIHGHNRKHLQSAICSGKFDLIVTGHTHKVRDQRSGRTRVVNPGALYRAATYTCATYDTATGQLELVEIPKTASPAKAQRISSKT